MPLELRRPISTWELKDPDVDPDDPYALRPDDERGTAAVGYLVNHYMLAVLTKGQATAIDALPGLRQTGAGSNPFLRYRHAENVMDEARTQGFRCRTSVRRDSSSRPGQNGHSSIDTQNTPKGSLLVGEAAWAAPVPAAYEATPCSLGGVSAWSPEGDARCRVGGERAELSTRVLLVVDHEVAALTRETQEPAPA
jgi:hypothetical protein